MASTAFLFQACEQGDLVTLTSHLNALSPAEIGAIRDEFSATLIHYAARYGHEEILRYLIERKRLNVIELLTEHGATCVHDAAVCNQRQAMIYLFDHLKRNSIETAPWMLRDDQGNTPVHLAAAYGSIQCLTYLLKNESADPHRRSNNGFQAIHYAALNGHDRCVKMLLLEAPTTINERTKTLLTPILLACQAGSMSTIQMLDTYKADFRLRDENGLTCLHTACLNGHFDVVRWLIETKRVKINEVDSLNSSALHYAAALDDPTILRYLLENQAEINRSKNGNTPLHVAAESGQDKACAILIDQGHCSVTDANSSELTPADLADRTGFSSLAAELRRQAQSTPMSQIQLNNATVVRLVVKRRNIERSDASNQVDESDLPSPPSIPRWINQESISSKALTNRRFDLTELRSRVERHEASRTDSANNSYQVTDVLMHSMESLNQQNRHRQRSKLPSQTYAPWLKMGNMSSEVFQEEIQRVGSNLRKVKRDDLLAADQREQQHTNGSILRTRQSQSVGRPAAMSDDKRSSSKRSELPPVSSESPVTKSHQFVVRPSTSNEQLDVPEWQRVLIERRRAAAANGRRSS